MKDQVELAGVIRWSHVVAFATIMSAFVGAIAFVHAELVVPAITSRVLLRAHEDMREQLVTHEQTIHSGAVSRAEFSIVRSQLDRIENRIDDVADRAP